MKKRGQILKVLLLTSIYCFGIFLSANNSTYFSTQNVDQNNEQLAYSATTSKILYVHTQQIENSLSDILEYSLPSFKLSNNDFLAISASNTLEFNATFKQYKNYLQNTLIRHRKSDLIFPFHNFW